MFGSTYPASSYNSRIQCDEKDDEDGEEFVCHVKHIPLPASERSTLQRRTEGLNLEKDLGKFRVVTAHTAKPLQGGWWCTVCECLLKDSQTWLDHINGRKHNRNLGMTMQVERKTSDDIKAKLSMKRLAPDDEAENAVEAAEARIAAAEEEEKEKKRKKKELKKRKKDAAGGVANDEASMLAKMGLPTGFG